MHLERDTLLAISIAGVIPASIISFALDIEALAWALLVSAIVFAMLVDGKRYCEP